MAWVCGLSDQRHLLDAPVDATRRIAAAAACRSPGMLEPKSAYIFRIRSWVWFDVLLA